MTASTYAYTRPDHAATAAIQREWARTGEHGWTEAGSLHSLCGWWVFPGMVMQAKYSNSIQALGLGDVRVVGRPYQKTADRYCPWTMAVESVETGERAEWTNYSYESHDCYVTAPGYMTSSAAFHAQFDGGPDLYADERFPVG